VGSAWFRGRAIDLSGLEVFSGRHRRRQCKHAALLVGPRHEIGSRAGEWLDTLASFDIELYCDGQLMDRGHVSNVLDGPLSAVRHLVELLSSDPDNLPLAAGEIVTSGTLTRALPVKAGETWTTKLNGIGLDGISLRFCF
jgi:2-oxo-3-hexenedioate decarboxylase